MFVLKRNSGKFVFDLHFNFTARNLFKSAIYPRQTLSRRSRHAAVWFADIKKGHGFSVSLFYLSSVYFALFPKASSTGYFSLLRFTFSETISSRSRPQASAIRMQ